jgi:hypothetical protein
VDILRQAYGWNLCKKLAKKDAFIDKSNAKGADNNADTIGFFAMGKAPLVWTLDSLLIMQDA